MTQLGFFPNIYEDEMFYSVLSRYHQKSYNNSKRLTLKDLELKNVIRMDIVQGIDALITKLKVYNYKTLTNIIDNHSFHKYYKNIYGFEQTNKRAYTKNNLEFRKNGFFNNEHLRFCLKCVESETDPYWHISHNIPGVNICLIHEEMLFETKVEFNKQEFIPLGSDIVKSSVQKKSNNITMHKKVALLSLQLFDIDLSELNLKSIYLQRLYEKSYIYNGLIDEKKLGQDVLEFFGESFFIEIGLSFEYVIREMYRNLLISDKKTFPLIIVLMQIFLGLKWNQLFDIYIVKKFLGINLDENIKCFNLFCQKHNIRIPNYRCDIYQGKISLNFKCDNCKYEAVIEMANSCKKLLLNEGVNCWDYIIYVINNKYLTVEELALKFDIPYQDIQDYINDRPKVYNNY